MKALALLLLPAAVLADPFLALETAHNLNAPMTEAMTPRAAERWESMFTEGRGIATIHDAKCSALDPNICLATWGWHRRGETQKGQLVVTLRNDKIDAFYYTEKPRKRRNAAMEGQAADSATTVVGLASGAAEANPILAGASGPAIAAVKLGTTYAVQRWASPNDCAVFSSAAGPVGYGAAAWNLGVLAGFGPLGVIPALGVTVASAHYAPDPIWNCLPEDL